MAPTDTDPVAALISRFKDLIASRGTRKVDGQEVRVSVDYFVADPRTVGGASMTWIVDLKPRL